MPINASRPCDDRLAARSTDEVVHGWAIFLLPYLEQIRPGRTLRVDLEPYEHSQSPRTRRVDSDVPLSSAGGPRFDSTGDTISVNFPFAVSDYVCGSDQQ